MDIRIVIALFLAFQGAPAVALRSTAEDAVITGRVNLPDGKPAVGVRVAAMTTAEDSQSPAALSAITQTDSAGRYRLEDIPPGRYYIAAGPLDEPAYYPGVSAQAAASLVTITRGQQLAGMDFTFTPPSLVRIRGRVVRDAVGRSPAPIPDTAQIRLNGRGRVQTATMAADGSFEFTNVRSGAYQISVNPGDGMKPVNITVTSEDIVGLTVTLPFKGTPRRVTGRVVVEDSSLEAARAIKAGYVQLSGGSRQDADIGADGTFDFPSVPPGAYAVDLISAVKPRATITARTSVQVLDEDVAVQLHVSPVALVSGAIIVDGDGLRPRVRLTFTPVGDSSTQETRVVEMGDVPTQWLLPVGEYSISAVPVSPGFVLKSITSGTTNILDRPLRFGVNDSPQLAIRLGIAEPREWVRVSGHVSGSPLPFSVTLGASLSARVNADGTFEFPAVLPGIYETGALPTGPFRAFPATTVMGQDLTNVEISLPVTRRIAGRVVLESGAGPTPQLRITLLNALGQRAKALLDLEPDGTFEVELPDGQYEVQIAPDRGTVTSFIYGSVDLFRNPFIVSPERSELRITVTTPPKR